MALRDWDATPATLATPATPRPQTGPSVATVATVATPRAAENRERRPATASEAAELRRLIRAVLADAPHEWEEVEETARADADAALECWRELAAGSNGGWIAEDDRRACQQCVNLTASGHCRAAPRGELTYVTGRAYSPVPDLLKRCEGYAPGPGDADRRPGRERWPGIAEDAERARIAK